MSTIRKPNSYKPGGTRPVFPEILPMSFDDRLARYTTHPAAKKSQRPDGLSQKQYRRLVRKLNHEFAVSEL